MTCVQTCSAKFVEFQTPFPFKFARPGVQNTLNGPVIPKGEWSRQQIVWRVRNWFWALVIPYYSRGDRATSWSHATRWWNFEGTVDIDGYTVWYCSFLVAETIQFWTKHSMLVNVFANVFAHQALGHELAWDSWKALMANLQQVGRRQSFAAMLRRFWVH